MILRVVRLSATGYLLLFLQIHEYLPFGNQGIRPDFLLLFVLYSALHCSAVLAVAIGFVAGYVIELFSATNSGLYITIYTATVITAKALQKYFDFDSTRNCFCLLLVCLLIKFLIFSFCFHFIYEYGFLFSEKAWFNEFVFTALLFPGVYYLIHVLLKQQRESPVKYHAPSHVYSVQRRQS